jgi:hypothetical protein
MKSSWVSFRILAFCFASVAALAGSARAGTQDQVKLALHAQVHTTKASLVCVPSESGGAAPTQLPCRDFVTAAAVGAGYDVYLVAANGYVSIFNGQIDQPGIAGISCGIDYDAAEGNGADVYSWSQCADGLSFDATGPNGPWPAAGSGIRLTWLTCPSPIVGPAGEQAVAGAFYVYAYSADQFRVTENTPLDSGPELKVADCDGAESDLPPEAAGRVDFSVGATAPGYDPCPGDYPPVCDVASYAYNFPDTPLGSYRDYQITIRNSGSSDNDPVVGTATLDCPDFQIVSGADYELSEPGSTHVITVRFTPTSTDERTCYVALGSTCPLVKLTARGALLPRAQVSPTAVDATVSFGNSETAALTVSNIGSARLSWMAYPEYGSLEDVRAVLDAGYASITALVPNLYLFPGGDSGTALYDPNLGSTSQGFNWISTDLGPWLDGLFPAFEYTGGEIRASDGLGPGGRYFTRKYPGLFVFAADMNGVNTFNVYGYLNVPVSRIITRGTFVTSEDGISYDGHYKQTSGGTQPSLNHLLVTADDPNVIHDTLDSYPGFERDVLLNTDRVTRLIYLVYMSDNGVMTDIATAQAILDTLLAVIHPHPAWLIPSPPQGGTDPGLSSGIQLGLGGSSLGAGSYLARMILRSNDPIEPVVQIPVRLTVQEPPPALELATAGFTAAALPGGEKTKPFDIGNTGGGELAFELTSPDAWIRPDPASGTVPPGGSATIQVTLSADGLDPGDDEGALALHTNDPDHPDTELPVLLHVGALDPAVAEVGPESLNPGSKGRWVTAKIELPDGYDPAQVDPASVRILGTVPVDDGGAVTGDFNRNGVPDWTFKFPRGAFVMALPPQDDVMVPVIGEVRDLIWFRTEQAVHIVRPHVLSPNGGERYGAGTWTTLRWSVPDGWEPSSFSVSYSPDAGATWTQLAKGITGTRFVWRLPEESAETAMIRVRAYDEDGVIGYDVSDAPFAVVTSTTGIDEPEIPAALVLAQNVPNPFRGSTVIRYALPAEGSVDLRVFDVFGREVRTLLDGEVPAGRGEATWDGRDRAGLPVSSGLYFYRLRTANGTVTRRMFLLP